MGAVVSQFWEIHALFVADPFTLGEDGLGVSVISYQCDHRHGHGQLKDFSFLHMPLSRPVWIIAMHFVLA